MSFEFEKSTGSLIKTASRLLIRVADQHLSEVGVTYAQSSFLILLWENEGQTQAELSQRSGIEQPTVVRTLDRMERDGLVERVKDPNDRRCFNIHLTSKAKKIAEELEKLSNEINGLATVGMSDSEVSDFNRVVLKVINNLSVALA